MPIRCVLDGAIDFSVVGSSIHAYASGKDEPIAKQAEPIRFD
jgi:hypothetical protein